MVNKTDISIRVSLKVYCVWKKKINESDLLQNVSNIKKNNWIKQRKAGIHFVPSNDFSLYDHVLDMCLTVNAVPDRFKKLKKLTK